MIDSIITFGFKTGDNNAHANCNDIFHPGNKIGYGVYVSPNIDTAKKYAGTIIIKGNKYLTLFLVKVRKNDIRKSNCLNTSGYWVLRGTKFKKLGLSLFYYLNFNFFIKYLIILLK